MDEPQGYIDFVGDDGQARPLKVQTYTLVPGDRLAANIRENMTREAARFHERANFGMARAGAAALVGSGPSLKDTLEDLRGFDGPIFACGSSHDHLVRNGIVPTYAVVCDGGAADKGNLSLRHKETTYLIASQCDPGMFDHLEGYPVEMWHYRGQAVQHLDEEVELLNGEPSIAWGSTVTLVTMSLAIFIGYQRLHFFGFDSSYGRHGLDQHVCQIAGSLEYQKVPVKLEGCEQLYISDLGLMTQADQFFRFVEMQREFFHATIHGDGLIAAMVRHGDPGLSRYVSLA